MHVSSVRAAQLQACGHAAIFACPLRPTYVKSRSGLEMSTIWLIITDSGLPGRADYLALELWMVKYVS